MKDFVAIDFETANFEQSSICSMGIVIVKDGELVDNFCAHYDDWRKCTLAKNLFKKYERQDKSNGKK